MAVAVMTRSPSDGAEEVVYLIDDDGSALTTTDDTVWLYPWQ